MVSTIRVSTHLPPIRAHRGGIVRGCRERERRATSCGLGETQNALPDATATDIRRTRADISTRCSMMRCVPPLGTRRPNTRRRMGCSARWDGGRKAQGRKTRNSIKNKTDSARELPDPGPRYVHHTVGIRLLLLRCRARTVNLQLRPAAVAIGLLCAGGPHSRDGALRLVQPERGTSSSVRDFLASIWRRSAAHLPSCRLAARRARLGEHG